MLLGQVFASDGKRRVAEARRRGLRAVRVRGAAAHRVDCVSLAALGGLHFTSELLLCSDVKGGKLLQSDEVRSCR